MYISTTYHQDECAEYYESFYDALVKKKFIKTTLDMNMWMNCILT